MASGRKRLTQREKKANAEFKREMQEKGFLPPDKPKLNREKYIKEAVKEWNGRNKECIVWEIYLIRAVSWMTGHVERKTLRRSLEAVGAAKILKIAVRLEKFSRDLKEKGRTEHRLDEELECIEDILNA